MSCLIITWTIQRMKLVLHRETTIQRLSGKDNNPRESGVRVSVKIKINVLHSTRQN
jgi:hypothetical protein